MKNYKKGSTTLVLIIVILIIAGIGFYFYSQSTQPEIIEQQQTQGTQQPSTSTSSTTVTVASLANTLYTYEEATKNQTRKYELFIADSTDGTGRLTMNGFQMEFDANIYLQSLGANRFAVIHDFQMQGGAPQTPQFKKGDTLLTFLVNPDKSISVQWNKVQPLLSQNKSGVTFKRILLEKN